MISLSVPSKRALALLAPCCESSRDRPYRESATGSLGDLARLPAGGIGGRWHLGGSHSGLSADEIEAAIAFAAERMAAAVDHLTRWNWWQELRALHGQRTPATVERLDRERGLA